jgi:beta-glucosidase
LGFQWMVMTDWWAVYDGKKVIESGQDLEMPACEATAEAEAMVRQGVVREEDIDRMVTSTLTAFKAMGLYEREPQLQWIDRFPMHVETALQTSREGTILLKNNGMLPIEKPVGPILATGCFMKSLAFGGGAAEVEGYDQIQLLDALKKTFGEAVQYLEHPDDESIRKASVVLMSVGTLDSEGWDRPFELPASMESEIDRVLTLNPRTVMIVQSGSGIRMTDWSDRAAAILYAWYPGQVGNQAIAEILAGKTNPSGKLPVTIEREFSDSVDPDYVPEGEALYHGWNDEEEKRRKPYDVHYDEGVFAGYRWYESCSIAPLFPFGFGLSYTTFEYSALSLSSNRIREDESLTVRFKLTNTGQRQGAEVAQIYVREHLPELPRPIKELKGFRKVTLDAGASEWLSLELKPEAFAFWCPESSAWRIRPGLFSILVGSSSASIHLEAQVHVLPAEQDGMTRI